MYRSCNSILLITINNFKIVNGVAFLTHIITEFRLADEFGVSIKVGSKEGLLLYEEGTVCDDKFNNHSANAICKGEVYVTALNMKTKEIFVVRC